jgi:hypothetical protein
MAGIRKVSWTFQLNKKSFPVQTIRQDSHYRAEMDQGISDNKPSEGQLFLDFRALHRQLALTGRCTN